jgi:hypothetical protein
MTTHVPALSSEFDIFASRPVQASVTQTTEIIYKPIAAVDQNDLEFLIPADDETYIDTAIKMYIKGRLVKEDDSELAATDYVCVTNNFLHSIFEQCVVILNGVTITQASEMYPYRAYLETILTYGTDAASTHLTNPYFYLDNGNMVGCDPTAAADTTTNKGFIDRWNRLKQSKEIELYGRIHTDLCNIPLHLLSGVRIQFKFTRSRSSFYVLGKDDKTKAKFKISDAQLRVNRVKPTADTLASHNMVLEKGGLARYHMNRVEIKSLTYAPGSKSISIDNLVLGTLPKRILFTMVKNTDMLGTIDSNPFNLRHYDLQQFDLYLNGRHYPNGGLTLDTSHEKSSVMAYRTLFEGSGLHHGNSGLLVTHDLYINGYFMLLFDLTPDLAASEGHSSPAESGNLRIELKFGKPLPDAITCLFYLEYNNSIVIDSLRNVSLDY